MIGTHDLEMTLRNPIAGTLEISVVEGGLDPPDAHAPESDECDERVRSFRVFGKATSG